MAVNALQVRAGMPFHTLLGEHASATPAAPFSGSCKIPVQLPASEQSAAICSDLQLSAAPCDLQGQREAMLVSLGSPAGRCWRCLRTTPTSAPWPWSCAPRRPPPC